MRPTLPAAAAALALTLTAAFPALATPATSGTGDSGLEQTIAPDQATVSGKVVLERGHVDIGPRLVDGKWSIQIHDDTVEPSVWRNVDDVVLRVRDAAVLNVPDNEAYAFLHADPGAPVHVVPQTQHPEVVWVGWNTQDPEVMDSVNLGATLSLYGVQGPGDLVAYLQSGNLGEPEPLWDSTKKAKQDIWVDVNTHTHANWAFTKPGVYLVDVGFSATMKSGETLEDRQVLRFAVGDDTEIEQARSEAYDTANSASGDGGDPVATAGEAVESAGTGVLVAVGIGAAVVLLIAAALISAARTRKARRLAAQRTGGGE